MKSQREQMTPEEEMKYDAIMTEKLEAIWKQLNQLAHEHLQTITPMEIDTLIRHLEPWAKASEALFDLKTYFEDPF